jgi:hypothetical protein
MSESAGPPSELNSESSSDHEDGDNHWRNSQAARKAPAGTGSESLIEDESPVAIQPEEDGFAFARICMLTSPLDTFIVGMTMTPM